jgi:hypothetical protein
LLFVLELERHGEVVRSMWAEVGEDALFDALILSGEEFTVRAGQDENLS